MLANKKQDLKGVIDIRHLIIGDVHGYHRNLRAFLVHMNVINKKGEAINRDKWKVYCTGDLIDGGTNRAGDILNMEFAPEWFDQVCLGNHEMAFIGGHDFGSRRKHDRKTLELLLDLIDREIYTPSILVDNYLLVHGGFSARFGFNNAADAHEYIKVMWKLAPDHDGEIAVFDWQGQARGYIYGGDVTGGIFELDWTENRNTSFNQVVGHSTQYDGPISKNYPDSVDHWNIDVGGKTGKSIGGIIVDDVAKTTESVFWGERHSWGKSSYTTYPPKVASPAVTPAPKSALVGVGSPTIKDRLFRDIRIEDFDSLDKIDIEIINDPEILEVYRSEVARGKSKIKDLIL